jgi:hypothetical protein
MDNIIDLIATDSSASDITDLIKDAIFAKSAEKINALRPDVANSLFNTNNAEETEE